MSQSKRDQAESHLRLIRQDLRDMYIELKDERLLPEPGQIRGLIIQMEALSGLTEKSRSKLKSIGNPINKDKMIKKRSL